MEDFNITNEIQDLQYCEGTEDTDQSNLYSRHSSPINLYLSHALSKLENTEAANLTDSGMEAITSVLMRVCKGGDHIISGRAIDGGTYAFLKNFFPTFNSETTFVDINNFESVENAIKHNTKAIYCESISNPLLEVADMRKLSEICRKYNLKLIVDNTSSPLSISPKLLGADIVIHSLTKFINGSTDTVGGVYCGTLQFINDIKNVTSETYIPLSSTLDSLRSASILRNLKTLPIRMRQHSYNAMYLAERFEKDGLKVFYPGLDSHKNHELMKSMMHEEYGFGGSLTLDTGTIEKAIELMELMQQENIDHLAVSLASYKAVSSFPESSASSEISKEEHKAIGISEGLISLSIGSDHDIERTYQKLKECMLKTGNFNHETISIF